MKKPNALDAEAIERQVELDKQLESLDQKEMELHQNQMKLLRDQLANFTREIGTLKKEMAELKGGREREEAQFAALQEQVHRETTDGRQEVVNVVATLEQMLHDHKAESKNLFDSLHNRHGSSLNDLKGEFKKRDQEHAKLHERLGPLERCLGESVNQLSELRDSHDQHVNAFSKHAKDMQDLKGSHAEQSSVPDRLAFLEQLVGDSIDGRSGFGARSRGRSPTGSLARMPTFSAQNSLKDRMEEIEKVVGLHGDSHNCTADKQAELESHHATLGERVKFLEKAIGDSAEAHEKELKKLKDASSAHSQHLAGLQTLHQHHSTVDERLNFIEKLLGDSADNHSDVQRVSRIAGGRSPMSGRGLQGLSSSTVTSILERLDGIEGVVGDTTNKHGKALEALRSSHDKHAQVVTKHAKDLEALLNHSQGHHVNHATLQERVDFLEKALGDSADHHAAAVAELHKKVAGEQAAREKHHGSIKDMLGQMQEGHGQRHASMQERLEFLEKVLGCSAETGQRGNGPTSFDDRVRMLERRTAEVMESYSKELQKTNSKVDACQSRLLLLREAWCVDTPRDLMTDMRR